MREDRHVLQDLIEPVVSGFWGESERQSHRVPCRVVRNGDVSKNGYILRRDLPIRFFTQYEHDKAQLLDGDIVLVSSGAYTGNAGIVVGEDDGLPVVVSNFVRRLRPTHGVAPGWLFHLVRSASVQRCVPAHTGGSAIPNLQSSLYAKCKLTYVPGSTVQQRIGEILSTVDEAFEQTEALIVKMQQIKAGLMHDLFSRGVTADGQLRPPREEAPQLYKESPLGWIPKEWGTCRIGSLLNRIIDYRGKTPVKTVSGVTLITAKNIRMGFIDPEPREYIGDEDYVTWMTRGIPVSTDVLFTTEAPLGNVAQVGTSERIAFAQRVIILQPKEGIQPGWLKFRLMSSDFQSGVARRASGTTALGIKQSEFRRVLVSYPLERNEQDAIEKRLLALEEAVWSNLGKVEKLSTIKTAVMSDLLTGRVQISRDLEASAAERMASV